MSNQATDKNIKGRDQLHQDVWQHLRDGNHNTAITTCNQLISRYPEFAWGWYTASHLTSQLGHHDLALSYIDKALQLAPDIQLWQVHKAQCLYATGNKEASITEAKRLSGITHAPASVYTALGQLLTRQDNNELALAMFEKAISADPANAGNYHNLATIQLYLGDTEAAEQSANKSIERKPDNYDAYWLRCSLRKQTPEHNHIVQMEAVAKAGIESWRGEMLVNYSLAKEYEDLQRYEESFARLKKGADIRRQAMKYDVARDEQTMENISQHFDKSVFEKSTPDDSTFENSNQNNVNLGYNNREPIFIIGLPRTGTTLAERIIGSHSEVFSAGELFNFEACLTAIIKEAYGDAVSSSDELVEKSTQIDFDELGRRYIDSSRPQTGHTPRFIDKLPFNFLYTGLIHLALPQAKIVNLVRHPMDTCYAIYKSLFQGAYSFSYDLNDMGHYYIAYRKLMDHWHSVMPNSIYNLSYENLVADTETETKKLLAFLELPWEDSCLKFYKNKNASKTASASQIRQPVYSSSVQKWRNYETQLQGLRNQLEDAGIEI